jgi:DNA-3-methyladenine glycosylase
MRVFDRRFYRQNTLKVTRRLLGQTIVRTHQGLRLSGIISEVEAYLGAEDSASHAFKGKTPRNSIMFGPPGFAYVYFIYGMHYMLNVVTEPANRPAAVLIRAMTPLENRRRMTAFGKRTGKDLSNGPAKLCQALAVDHRFNGWDLTRGEKLWIETRQPVPKRYICSGSRIGIAYAGEDARQAPWRLWLSAEYRPHL